jgi:hypothetical protein
MAKSYAWSDIYFGGNVEDVKTPVGGIKTVVTERFIVPRGEEVTQSKIKVSKEEWDHLVDTGSVRPYPLPEEASDVISPTQAILTRLSQGTGEIDQNMLMELALAHPPATNLPAEEEKEAEAVPKGA